MHAYEQAMKEYQEAYQALQDAEGDEAVEAALIVYRAKKINLRIFLGRR